MPIVVQTSWKYALHKISCITLYLTSQDLHDLLLLTLLLTALTPGLEFCETSFFRVLVVGQALPRKPLLHWGGGKRNVASIYAWAKAVTDVTLDFSSSLHEYDSRVRAPDIFQDPCLQLCLLLGTTLSLCCHLGPLTLSRSLWWSPISALRASIASLMTMLSSQPSISVGTLAHTFWGPYWLHHRFWIHRGVWAPLLSSSSKNSCLSRSSSFSI